MLNQISSLLFSESLEISILFFNPSLITLQLFSYYDKLLFLLFFVMHKLYDLQIN